MANNLSDRLIDLFVYGYFIDPDILRYRGVTARNPRSARVQGYRRCLGSQATLLRQPGAECRGLLYALTHSEIERLYDGLDGYRPEAVLALLDADARSVSAPVRQPALTMVLLEPPSPSERNVRYESDLRATFARIGIEYSDSELPEDLISAYVRTRYRVLGATPAFELRIGEYSPRLAGELFTRQKGNAAFLTAWNPHSAKDVPEAVNRAAQLDLEARLVNRGCPCVPGIGLGEATEWAEPSVLAFGLDRPIAIELGRAFAQNAIVWSADDAIPELILLR